MTSTSKNIVLCGNPGVGKTTVAQIVANKLGLKFVDTDKQIEKQFGISVKDIFAKFGEKAFRKAEKLLIENLSKEYGCVIATGGGSLLSRKNLQNLQACGDLFCLNANLNTLAIRLNKSSRPLLKEKKLKNIVQERAPGFQTIFHQIDTTKLTPERTAEQIQRLVHLNKELEAKSMLWVSAKDQKYPIKVESEGLNALADYISFLGLHPDKIIVFSHDKLFDLYGGRIDSQLNQLKMPHEYISIHEGEKSKSLTDLGKLYKKLLKVQATRQTLIIALGGGVVGDVAGFVASTFMRGLPLLLIPTTLLAMVDSSIGGKTGVNLDDNKNIVGTFYPPKGILIDPQLLMSLPVIEYQCGMAEVIKHAIIGDEKLWDMISDPEQIDLEEMICRAISVKAQIVSRDYDEQGERMVLNLGHTFGHAIEKLSGFSVKHGHAVAMGLCMAADYALTQNLCEPNLPGRIQKMLKTHGLPHEQGLYQDEQIFEAMKHDKKRAGKIQHLIIPKAIGEVEIEQISV